MMNNSAINNISIGYDYTGYQQQRAPDSSNAVIDENTSQRSDSVEISDEAKGRNARDKSEKNSLSTINELTDKDKRAVEELKKQDREVKTHEMAHVAGGAGIVRGGPRYSYKVGPDGKRYAVGGHVKIDTSAEKEPEDTVRKMQRVKQAALAPVRPSGTDRAVAAKASQTEAEARGEISKERIEKVLEAYAKVGQDEQSNGVYEISNYSDFDIPLAGKVIVTMKGSREK